MKILLDECVDWRLARDLVGHHVKTAVQMGWAGSKNGELLTHASEQLDNLHHRGSKLVLSTGPRCFLHRGRRARVKKQSAH